MNRENAFIMIKKRLAFTKIDCDSNQLIAFQGDQTGLIYLVEKGWAKLSKVSGDGKETSINICAPGELIGLSTLFRKNDFPVNVTTISPCRLLAFNKNSLEKFLLQNPQIMAVIMAELGNQVLKLSGIKIATNQQDAYGQVWILLVHFANVFGINVSLGRLIPFNLTQQDIADFVGLSRPRVSICLNSLLKSGFIRRQGRYYVLTDSAAENASGLNQDYNPMFSVKYL